MQATDLEIELSISIPAEGELEACLVDAEKLMTRIKAGKHETCVLGVQRTGETVKDEWGDWESYNLIVNGGKVNHTLPGECLKDFCVNETPIRPVGALTVSGQEIIEFLPVALTGIAKENTRYAIKGILLDIGKTGRKGKYARLIATDGRRMVRIDLKAVQTEAVTLQTILGEKACSLLRRLLGKKSKETIQISVNEFVYEDSVKHEDGTPKDRPTKIIIVTAENWTLKTLPVEGHFPQYEDVWPRTDLNDWTVQRAEFEAVFTEVAVANTEDDRGMYAYFSPDKVKLTAGPTWSGASEGAVGVEFISGKDEHIITRFNALFMKDVLRQIDSETLTFRLVQNKLGLTDNRVYGAPIQIIGNQVSWLVMPINLDMEPSIETLGTNYAAWAERTCKSQAVAVPA